MKHCWEGNQNHFVQTTIRTRPSATLMENFIPEEWSVDAITMASKVGHLECMKLLYNYYKVKPQCMFRLKEICSYSNIECYKWVLETFKCNEGSVSFTDKINQLTYSIYGKNIECFKYIYEKIILEHKYVDNIYRQKFGLQHMDIFDWQLEYIRKDYPNVFCDIDELKWIDSELDMLDIFTDSINSYTYAICFRFPRIQEFIINSYDIIDKECLTNVYKLYKEICLVMKEKAIEVLKEETKISLDIIEYVIKGYL
jgi:hypothetical protein